MRDAINGTPAITVAINRFLAGCAALLRSLLDFSVPNDSMAQ
jgi:hypothetical protein